MTGLLSRLTGRRTQVTVPPLDGPWTPNDVLEQCRVFVQVDDLVDAVLTTGGLCVLTRTSVLLVDPATGDVRASTLLPAPGTAICATAHGLLVAMEELGLTALESETLQPASAPPYAPGLPTIGVTAVVLGPDGALWVAQGSSGSPVGDWTRDLMTQGSSGSVWRADATSCVRVADRLAWPAGLLVDGDGQGVVVAEAWRHRLVHVARGGAVTPVLDDLPAYPGSISPNSSGGFLLACPLPRSSLVEFVLNETDFVAAMLDSMDERAWVAPQLRTLRHPLEQVQGGELLVFGQVKPWAPTRSYGLAVLLDPQLQPLRSLHSRANGRQHGISRVLEHGDGFLTVSRGAGTVSQVQAPRSWRAVG